jgi:hypothetical protein
MPKSTVMINKRHKSDYVFGDLRPPNVTFPGDKRLSWSIFTGPERI